MARLLLCTPKMIVSALVVTSRRSMPALMKSLCESEFVEVGSPCGGFLPLVTTASTLSESRRMYEALRSFEGIDDLQLVSWTDEDAVFDSLDSIDFGEPKEDA